MAVQRLKKSTSLRRYLSVGVLCVLSMIAFNSASIAQEAAVSGVGGGQQSDTVHPKLVYDGALIVPYNGYDIKLYRGAREGETPSSPINRNTLYFHEPLIHFRTDADGRLKNEVREGGGLTLYVAMNILEQQTLEEVKSFLKERKDVSESDLPLDANIQPLSARGWFESSANEDIRSAIGDVTMSSRRGPDIHVHFPISTREADSFLSRLNADVEQLTFKYSLQGNAIEVCTVHATAEAMTNHRRFHELVGDASGDGRYVSRDQIADLMSQISRHESISSNCRSESVAKELRDKALERLADKAESGFLIDHLDGLTNSIQDDIRADIDNSSNKIRAKEEREQIQKLSQKVRSGATSFGLFVKAIVEAIPFVGELTVDTSHASGEAYQSMWDSLSRVHDQLEWTGTAYRPKRVDVYRKEQLRNALNTSIHFRHETPVFAEDVRSIRISKKGNWIPDDTERPSSISPLEALSTRLAEAEERLAAAQEMIKALKAGVEAARLGTHPRPDRSGVWVKGTDFEIDAKVVENVHDGRMRRVGGDIDLEADDDIDLEADDRIRIYAKGYRRGDDTAGDREGGEVNIDARNDIDIEAGGEIEIEAHKDIEIGFGGGKIDMDSGNKRISIKIKSSRESGSETRLRVSENRAQLRTRHGSIKINDGTIELNAYQIKVNGQSLMDYIRDRY